MDIRNKTLLKNLGMCFKFKIKMFSTCSPVPWLYIAILSFRKKKKKFATNSFFYSFIFEPDIIRPFIFQTIVILLDQIF